MGKAIIIAVIIIAVMVIVSLLIIAVNHALNAPVTRRREVKEVERRLNAAENALEQIHTSAAQWDDIDSILATEVRKQYAQYIRSITRKGN